MKIEVVKFLELSENTPIVDVRSPLEFEKGHIPGAYNIPLFNNEERAIVGTLYKQKGRQNAILEGLDIVGPKMRNFVEEARMLSKDNLLIYCWRGGMRSESMAWLFNLYGFKTGVLTGGYKAYRKYIRNSFSQPSKIMILGGLTGSGKTELLEDMAEKGAQVLNLEKIANHKGSAFGALGQNNQPSNEYFENLLAKEWLSFDKDSVIWIEDESHSIGSVWIPDPLYLKMRDSKVIKIECSKEERIKRLVKDYACFENADLEKIIYKIGKRLGGQHVKRAVKALNNREYEVVADIVLTYYDKTYSFGLETREKNSVIPINLDNVNGSIVDSLLEKENLLA